MNSKSRVMLRWRKPAVFVEEVAEKIKGVIPVGTQRPTAESRIVQSFECIPSYHRSNRAFDKSIWNCAEVPENVSGGVIIFLVRPNGLVGSVFGRFWRNDVLIFLLLDGEGQVQDYRFLSLTDCSVGSPNPQN
jgi:hypothetical protein